MSMHVEYPHKSSPIGPVLYSVSYDKADTYRMRRFKEFETLDTTLKQTDAAAATRRRSTSSFPSPETLAARATALEKYLIALLETGSPDIVRGRQLCQHRIQRPRGRVRGGRRARARAVRAADARLLADGHLLHAPRRVVGARRDRVPPRPARARGRHGLASQEDRRDHPDPLLERIAPYIKTTLIKHTTAQIAKVPPSVKRIASVSADVATRKASLSDGLNVPRHARRAGRPALPDRRRRVAHRAPPATSRVVPFVETHWPQLVEEVRARTFVHRLADPAGAHGGGGGGVWHADGAQGRIHAPIGRLDVDDDRLDVGVDLLALSTLPDSQFAPATAAPKAPSSKA